MRGMSGAQGPADAIRQWAHDICAAASVTVPEVCAVIGLDLSALTRIGSQQLRFAPLPGTSRIDFVLERAPGEDTVAYVHIALVDAIAVESLTKRFGEGRVTSASLHDPAPTVIFADVWPDEAKRGCTLLATLDAGWPRHESVSSIVLYLQTQPQ